MASKSTEDDTEPSVLQYARFHGLVHAWVENENFEHQVFCKVPLNLRTDLEDPLYAPVLSLPDNLEHQEKLIIPAAAARLLVSVKPLVTSLATESQSIAFDETDLFSASNLKLDLPLLKDDPELRILQFRRQELQPLDDVDPNVLALNTEYNRILDWYENCLQLPAEYDGNLNSEKLELSRDHLLLIQSSIRSECPKEERIAIFEDDTIYKKNTVLEPHTPPLLPQSPPQFLTDVSTPVEDQISAMSSKFWPIDENAFADKSFPEQPLREKSIFDETIDDKYCDRFLLSPRCTSASPESKKVGDLKIDDLLIPTLSSTSPALSPDHEWWRDMPTLRASRTPRSSDKMDDDESEFEALFRDIINPMAVVGSQKVQNEQLEEADSTKRVHVPDVKFSMPMLPWEEHSLKHDEEEDLKDLMQPIAKLKLHHWPGISKIERDLPWSPFPNHLGMIALGENIPNDRATERILLDVLCDHPVNHEILSGRSMGFRVGNEQNQDESELDPLPRVDTDEMERLIRKRKRDFDSNTDVEREGTTESMNQCVMSPIEPIKSLAMSEGKVQKHQSGPPTNFKALNTKNFFSASNEVDRFIRVLGNTIEKPKIRFPDAPSPCEPQLITDHTTMSKATRDHSEKAVPQAINSLIPIPESIHLTTRNIVVASALFAERTVMRCLTELYPSLEIIEREFTDISQAADRAQTGASNTVIRCREADIAISPCTGIIMTTLQKIKQKALPGQKAKSPIKEAITSIAPLYETLIILVSQSFKGSEFGGPLGDRDCEALVELSNFSDNLEEDITISFVAGGDENTARFIINLIYSLTRAGQETSSLLAEETLWELFLRKAGMNSFAAQVVLRELKPASRGESWSSEAGFSSSMEISCSQPRNWEAYGLSVFVLMRLEKRLEKFQRMLGGRKVLVRTSRVLDAEWDKTKEDMFDHLR